MTSIRRVSWSRFSSVDQTCSGGLGEVMKMCVARSWRVPPLHSILNSYLSNKLSIVANSQKVFLRSSMITTGWLS